MRECARLIFTSVLLTSVLLTGCLDTVPDNSIVDDPKFPLQPHLLYPTTDFTDGQIAAGKVTGRALEQPIQFPHYTHAVILEMDCQFCHSEARKSIHAGVPPVQTCVNCHANVPKVKDSPEIQKVMEHCGTLDAKTRRCENGKPIPWNRVHDLPDYVHFSHKRHVRAGVDCTECHGQVANMGRKELVKAGVGGEPDEYEVGPVMIRESRLQMGWCLDCHFSHPSIDKNYGDKADLRRAELRDCWTCHK